MLGSGSQVEHLMNLNNPWDPSEGTIGDMLGRLAQGAGMSQVLYQRQAVPATQWQVTGTTSKTTLLAIPIPRLLVGIFGSLEVEALWGMPNNANAKTIGAEFVSGGTILNVSAANAGSVVTRTVIRNQGVTNSQVAMPAVNPSGAGVDGNALATFAIDFTVDQVLNFFGTLGNAGDNIQLRGVTIKVSNP